MTDAQVDAGRALPENEQVWACGYQEGILAERARQSGAGAIQSFRELLGLSPVQLTTLEGTERILTTLEGAERINYILATASPDETRVVMDALTYWVENLGLSPDFEHGAALLRRLEATQRQKS